MAEWQGLVASSMISVAGLVASMRTGRRAVHTVLTDRRVLTDPRVLADRRILADRRVQEA